MLQQHQQQAGSKEREAQQFGKLIKGKTLICDAGKRKQFT